ncbi:MAG TPA: peptide ABC transporter substrate-binding protein [Chloroflexota bacterium]|nr:peptide ABC transporter substrate-binding protein [Chloroflexota bacterium]
MRSLLLPIILAQLLACAPRTQPPTAEQSPAHRGGVVRVALWQEPALLNPLLGVQTVNDLISRTMLEGLLRISPEGQLTPQLAAEVPTFDNGGISPNGLTITWRLKTGVRWSDGQPFTSKDVLFTYAVTMDPANPITNQAGYPDIETITAPDDATVVVRYRTIYSAFKQHFEWVLPEHVFGGDTAIETKEFNHAPTGTGPFKFKAWEPGSAITVERNPHFREADKPRLDGLIFRIVPARDIGILWLKAGEVDALWNLAEDNIPEIEAIPSVVMNPAVGNGIERLILNTSCPSGSQQGDPACRHPVLGDVRVRQAIDLAIDRRALIDELLAGKTTVATSVIPLGPYAVGLAPPSYDPVAAQRLLEDAGWHVGADGIRVNDAGTRASLSFTTTTGARLRDQTQALIKQQLQAVGIDVNIENLPSPMLFGSWQDGAPMAHGNFDIAMFTITDPYDPQADLYNLFHSSRVPSERVRAGQNYQRILDPELDAALEAASVTVDDAKRAAAFQKVAGRVDADKGHILLYRRLDLDAYNQRVKGHAPNVWSEFTWNAADWWLDDGR